MQKPTFVLFTLIFLSASASGQERTFTTQQIEFFENKIRPVFAENCQRCHGIKRQRAKLSLADRASILKGGESGAAIVVGQPEKSRLIEAIRYGNPDLRMPPRGKLPAEHIANLEKWVKMGAPWPDEKAVKKLAPKTFDLKARSKFWSLQPLQKPDIPDVKNRQWSQSPIDAFILAKLEAKGLQPAGRADKRTLIRRATFDLIGLPPTPEEIADFVNDDSPGAFANVIDRLLASPHYGERWGRHWLDLVRFAETHGHEFDFEIFDAWRYRDYVIRAINADVPYNRFVIEHIAGDLLPNPRRQPATRWNESILGTGFWWLGEAKHSPVDVRGDQADRIENQIDVFGKTFLGMTLACAKCHDHKFDAITTKDYYSLAGYIQSSRYQHAFLDAPEDFDPHIDNITKKIEIIRKTAIALAAKRLEPHLTTLATKFAKTPNPPAAETSLFEDFNNETYAGWYATGHAFGDGPSQGRNVTLHGDKRLPIQQIVKPGVAHSGLISNRLQGVLRSKTFLITSKLIHVLAAGRKAKINVILDGLTIIRNPIYGGLTRNVNHGDDFRWQTIDVSMWQGHRAYLEFHDENDGYFAADCVAFADAGPPPLPGNNLIAKAPTDEKRVAYFQRLFADVLRRWSNDELDEDQVAILNWMLQHALPMLQPADAESLNRITALQNEIQELERALPNPTRAIAIADGSPVNEYVFLRGNHKKLGKEAPRRFLEVFDGDSDRASKTGSGRLQLAKHMTDPNRTPILPRVMVNRIWKHHFGEGIVQSADDFGVLGHRPTHPELLDYLAGEFIRNGWSLKKMHRMMMLTSAYQMTSHATPQADEQDPANKLLHKMRIRRLEGEMIRDTMLAVSGQLRPTMFGKGVLPHLTPFMAGRGRPRNSGPLDGAGRRSIYINVRRNFLTPMFVAFDYPTPFSTIGRRSVSNVPAQALTLMNNPFVLQQAQRWGERMANLSDISVEKRITLMYQLGFGRDPAQGESNALASFVHEQAKMYSGINDARVWTDLAHALFNVKEFIYVQ